MRFNKLFRSLSFILPGFLLLALSACTTAPKPVMHKALQGDVSALPGRLLILPPEVTVSEVSAGGVVEKDQAWSDQAQQSLQQSLEAFFAEKQELSIIPFPTLDAAQEKLVHDHILLYDVVAGHTMLAKNIPVYGWADRIADYDYTLGDGLKFLKQQTGADAGLFLIGVDYVSTGGRKAMTVAAALVGVAMPVGSSTLLAGVVDLESGDILWLKYAHTEATRDMRQYEDTLAMVRDVFSDYR